MVDIVESIYDLASAEMAIFSLDFINDIESILAAVVQIGKTTSKEKLTLLLRSTATLERCRAMSCIFF